MATLRFDGNDKVEGAGQGVMNGALTLIALVQKTGSSHGTIIGARSSGANTALSLDIKASNIPTFFNNSTGSSDGVAISINTSNWFLVAVTRATGSGKPRYHIKNLSGGAWTHADGDSVQGTNPSSVVGGNVQIGTFRFSSDSQFWVGDIGLVGWWDGQNFSDAQVESLITGSKTSTLADTTPNPTSLTELNTLTPVDLMGLMTWTSSGPVLTGSDPTGWTFDGVGSAPEPEIESGGVFLGSSSGWVELGGGGGESGGGEGGWHDDFDTDANDYTVDVGVVDVSSGLVRPATNSDLRLIRKTGDVIPTLMIGKFIMGYGGAQATTSALQMYLRWANPSNYLVVSTQDDGNLIVHSMVNGSLSILGSSGPSLTHYVNGQPLWLVAWITDDIVRARAYTSNPFASLGVFPTAQRSATSGTIPDIWRVRTPYTTLGATKVAFGILPNGQQASCGLDEFHVYGNAGIGVKGEVGATGPAGGPVGPQGPAGPAGGGVWHDLFDTSDMSAYTVAVGAAPVVSGSVVRPSTNANLVLLRTVAGSDVIPRMIASKFIQGTGGSQATTAGFAILARYVNDNNKLAINFQNDGNIVIYSVVNGSASVVANAGPGFSYTNGNPLWFVMWVDGSNVMQLRLYTSNPFTSGVAAPSPAKTLATSSLPDYWLMRTPHPSLGGFKVGFEITPNGQQAIAGCDEFHVYGFGGGGG